MRQLRQIVSGLAQLDCVYCLSIKVYGLSCEHLYSVQRMRCAASLQHTNHNTSKGAGKHGDEEHYHRPGQVCLSTWFTITSAN